MSLRRSNLTPEQRSSLARLAALRRWSQTTPQERTQQTQAARDGLAAKWADAANPEAAMKAHMVAMAISSSRSRSTA